jgi:hypothetical protein
MERENDRGIDALSERIGLLKQVRRSGSGQKARECGDGQAPPTFARAAGAACMRAVKMVCAPDLLQLSLLTATVSGAAAQLVVAEY